MAEGVRSSAAPHTHHTRVHPNPDQVRDLDNITHPNPTPNPNPDQVRELDDITNLPLTLTLILPLTLTPTLTLTLTR